LSRQEPTVSLAAPGVLSSADKFNLTQVLDHATSALLNAELKKNGNTTLSCVDARHDDPMHGSPGGDLAEIAAAFYLYFRNWRGPSATVTMADMRPLFKDFLNRFISEQRPLYFHTDDTKLRVAFERIAQRVGRSVSVLPVSSPAQNETEIWLDELSKSDVQGCGHIRLMIADPQGYGLDSNAVIRNVIKLFYEQWWAASPQDKHKFDFVVKIGGLIGRAVAIVSSTSANDSCASYSPAIIPSLLGSSMFVYTPASAQAFRTQILTPFFGTNIQGFAASLEALLSKQLNQTLYFLPPANSIDLFTVEFSSVAVAQSPPASDNAASKTSTGYILASTLILILATMLF